MKSLKYYEKSAQPLPIKFTTQGLQLKVGSNGILWRARTVLLKLAVKNG